MERQETRNLREDLAAILVENDARQRRKRTRASRLLKRSAKINDGDRELLSAEDFVHNELVAARVSSQDILLHNCGIKFGEYTKGFLSFRFH